MLLFVVSLSNRVQKYIFIREVKTFSYFCNDSEQSGENNNTKIVIEMKKWILGVMLLALTISANAQFEAGTKYFGLSATGVGLSYSTNEKFRLGMNASAGIFLADQVLVKADVGYNHTDAIDDFNTGLGLRYYFSENGIFIGAGGEFDHFTPNRNDVMIPVELGYAFYLNHYITFEPSVYYKMSLDDFSNKSMVGLKIGFGFYF
jgi:hypothetical protein